MGLDLWGFRSKKDLELVATDTPATILKKQIDLLAEKTDYILYGKSRVISVKSENVEFKIAIIFDVIVPKLDNYTKTILIMYSNPEDDYPVAITYGSNYEDDCDDFAPNYICDDKESFVGAVAEILSSSFVMDTIKALYSKAYSLEQISFNA